MYVAELTADERDEMEQGWIGYRSQHNGADDDNVGFRAYTVAYCLCDANRQRLFAGRNRPPHSDWSAKRQSDRSRVQHLFENQWFDQGGHRRPGKKVTADEAREFRWQWAYCPVAGISRAAEPG